MKYRSNASTKPSIVGSAARMSGARPSRAAAVFAVLGPMQAIEMDDGKARSPSADAKFLTVDELVNVTASIVPSKSRRRTTSASAASTVFS